MTMQSNVQAVADLVAGHTHDDAVAALTEAGYTVVTRGGQRIIEVDNEIRVQMIGSRVSAFARPYWTVFAIAGGQAMPVKVAAV